MNNTKRRRTLAVSAILAVTLVVGGMLAAATSTQTASAYLQKKIAQHDDKGKHNEKGNGNTDTDTNQNCNNKASASGLDPEVSQDCEPLICTHPNNNSACTQEGVTAAGNNTVPVKKFCDECFTTLLTPQQVTNVVIELEEDTLARVCTNLHNSLFSEGSLRQALISVGVSERIADELITCLKQAGIVFKTS